MGEKITVLGSLNIDFITSCKRAAKPGETVLGTSFSKCVGGKGANIAYALARLGERPLMLGLVGDDGFGSELISALKGVDTSQIRTSKSSSGLAQIILEKDGTNRIIVVPGANLCVSKKYVFEHAKQIKASKILISQLEIPQPAVLEGFKIAQEKGVLTLLNYSPALDFACPILEYTNILVLNEEELKTLSKGLVNPSDFTQVKAYFKTLFKRFCTLKIIILTLGKKGVFYAENNRTLQMPAYKTPKIIDTTGAGDCFIASFVLALLRGYVEAGKDLRGDILGSKIDFAHLKLALDFACKAAAFSVSKKGSTPSYPSLEELELFCKGELKS